MTIAYIYEDPTFSVSSNYHSGGSVLLITDDDPNAALARLLPYREQSWGGPWGVREGEEFEPTASYELANPEPERLFVFPDAGCC